MSGWAAALPLLLASLAVPTVTLEARPQPLVVEVEVADTPEKQARGLMFVRELPAGHGMLFVFPSAKVHRFWMVNTFIPLDMVFLDADWRVVDVVHRAEPHSAVGRGGPMPSRYVLELAGGTAAAHAIVPGSRVHFGNS